jgi:hypothetical protein
MPRILIAGGYGLVGGTIAREVRSAHPDVSLILGGRNPESGAALAAELGNTRCVRIDVANPGAALDETGPVDLIAAILKDPTDALFAESLKRKIPHIGITKTADEIAPQLFLMGLHPVQQPTVMLGHWQAGVMAYAAAALISQFSAVDRIELAALYDPSDPIGPMTAGDSEEFFGRALIREAGQWRWVDPNANMRSIKRPSAEPFDAMPMGVLDVPSLAMLSGAPDVRFDLGVGDSIGTLGGGTPSHDMYVTVTGKTSSGERVSRRLSVIEPKGQACATSKGVLVAIERVLGLDGAAPVVAGLHSPETLAEPNAALARLKELGIDATDIQSEEVPA